MYILSASLASSEELGGFGSTAQGETGKFFLKKIEIFGVPFLLN